MAKYSKTGGNVNLNVTVNNYYNQRNNSIANTNSTTAMLNLIAASKMFTGLDPFNMFNLEDQSDKNLIEDNSVRDISPDDIFKDDIDNLVQGSKNVENIPEDVEFEILEVDGGSPVSLISTNRDVKKGVVTCVFEGFDTSKSSFTQVQKIFSNEILIEGYNWKNAEKYIGYANDTVIVYRPHIKHNLFNGIIDKFGRKFRLSYNAISELDILPKEPNFYLIVDTTDDINIFKVRNDNDFIYFELLY